MKKYCKVSRTGFWTGRGSGSTIREKWGSGCLWRPEAGVVVASASAKGVGEGGWRC
jgi:hypothetical protein